MPVPEVLWLEENARWLGAPFFVMEEIVGFEAGQQIWEELAESVRRRERLEAREPAS